MLTYRTAVCSQFSLSLSLSLSISLSRALFLSLSLSVCLSISPLSCARSRARHALSLVRLLSLVAKCSLTAHQHLFTIHRPRAGAWCAGAARQMRCRERECCLLVLNLVSSTLPTKTDEV